jgi:hypothetical protein
MTNPTDQFAQQKYAVVRGCLADPQLSLLYRYACKRASIDTMVHDAQVPDAWSAHGDLFMDGLLLDTLPLAEEVTQAKLFPTYSYFRVYKNGDVLAKHKDRPSCEISLSVCLGYEAETPWPIWIEGTAGVTAIELMPGDALFYRGIECAHWREALIGERAVQVFLHYVDQNGPYAEWKFDKRPSLSSQRLPVNLEKIAPGTSAEP